MIIALIIITGIILFAGIVLSYRNNTTKDFIHKNFDTAAIQFLIFLFSLLISFEIYSYRQNYLEKQKIERINLEKKDIKESILVNLENEFNFILETMDRINTNTNDNYSYVRLNTILLEAVIKNEYRQINDFELLTRVKKLIIELDKINRQLDFKNATLTNPLLNKKYKIEEISETNNFIKNTIEKSKHDIEEIKNYIEKQKDK